MSLHEINISVLDVISAAVVTTMLVG